MTHDETKLREEWKQVKGYVGLYMVSNTGKVLRLARTVIRRNKNPYFVSEQILKPTKYNGYYRLKLLKDKNEKRFLVSRLVAIAFIKNKHRKPYVNHIDCDTENNHVSNLEWCTQKENMSHASKLGRMRKKR